MRKDLRGYLWQSRTEVNFLVASIKENNCWRGAGPLVFADLGNTYP